MLLAVIISISLISKELNLSFNGVITEIKQSKYSEIFNWDWRSRDNFFKQFLAGTFMAIVMTGLDQDMMQKNLTCRSLKDSQKNMFWFSISLLFVNLMFLSLGTLLYTYFSKSGINLQATDSFHYSQEAGKFLHTDKLYPELAINHFGKFAGITFILGIIAAAFSSADSALTSLTTSFMVDILGIDVKKETKSVKKSKQFVHIGFSLIVLLVILIFKWIAKESVINMIFSVATYTYGPLLGLYSFGLFTKRQVKDKAVPAIAILSPIFTFAINYYSVDLMNGYKFGFELLLVNGLFTFIGLLLISKQKKFNLTN
jgi:Na+/proline symporter